MRSIHFFVIQIPNAGKETPTIKAMRDPKNMLAGVVKDLTIILSEKDRVHPTKSTLNQNVDATTARFKP